MAGRVSSERFVGRAAELAALESESGAVVVAGDAGVGKSRLVAELERRARADGKLVLVGECLELSEGELPYAPIVAALRPVLREPDALDGLGAADVGELARLWPELGPAPSSDSSQARLFSLLLGLLNRLAERQPVVMVIEDLHWADRSTRDFVAFLVRAGRGGQLSLIGTLRNEELGADHPVRAFIAELSRVRGVRRLELQAFSREELAAQVDGILGEQPASELVQRLFERSEGNAFYTEELLAAGTGAELPASLRDTLLVRIDRLSEPARRLLAVAATAGRPVDERLLAAAGELDPAELTGALREALDHHVLVVAGASAYAFRHALVREAVYRDLLAGERARLHGAIARALLGEANGGVGTAGELAHHWYAAGDFVSAFEASVAASADAERALAFYETQSHSERALELWDQVPDAAARAGITRPRLLIRAASAAVRVDQPERSAELARAALDELDPARDRVAMARSYILLGRGLWLSAEHAGALAAYREAVALVPPDPPSSIRALVLAGEAQALMLGGASRQAKALCDEALAIARVVGDRFVEAHVHNTLAGVGWAAGDPVEHAAQARRIAVEMMAVEEIGRSYANGSEALDAEGRVDEAIALAEEGIASVSKWGLHDFVGYLGSSLAVWYVRHGRFEAAGRLLGEPTPHGTTAAAPRHAARGRLAAARGEFTVAERELLRAVELSRGLGGPEWFPPALAALGMVRLWQGRLDQAVALLREALAAVDDLEYGPWLPDFADVYPTAARIAADRADAEEAADAVARLDAMLSTLPRDHRPPRAAACRALAAAEAERAAGRSDSDAWRAAGDTFAALKEPYAVAYARYREAEALVAGRRDAREPLRDAHAAVVALHERPLRAEIEALARRARVALGEDEPAPDPADELGITAREREVLELLAAGATNREIASALVISEKTASVHVSHILAKLGARNRGEAAATAHRLGLGRERD